MEKKIFVMETKLGNYQPPPYEFLKKHIEKNNSGFILSKSFSGKLNVICENKPEDLPEYGITFEEYMEANND